MSFYNWHSQSHLVTHIDSKCVHAHFSLFFFVRSVRSSLPVRFLGHLYHSTLYTPLTVHYRYSYHGIHSLSTAVVNWKIQSIRIYGLISRLALGRYYNHKWFICLVAYTLDYNTMCLKTPLWFFWVTLKIDNFFFVCNILKKLDSGKNINVPTSPRDCCRAIFRVQEVIFQLYKTVLFKHLIFQSVLYM